ncbi:hypothetical protein ACFXJO_16500 [Streptomyces lavendulae]|uniref:hypothetical protein n=1 Tax=Streptomyces lavendulae TaxID=1914 RepID=UPI00369C5B21
MVSRSGHTLPPSTFAMVSRLTPLRRESSAIDQPLTSMQHVSWIASSWATLAPW